MKRPALSSTAEQEIAVRRIVGSISCCSKVIKCEKYAEFISINRVAIFSQQSIR